MTAQNLNFVKLIDELTETLETLISTLTENFWVQSQFSETALESLLRARAHAHHYSAGLTVGLLGGTGVGKSSLINFLAGTEISRSSVRRPYTERIILYKHTAAALPDFLKVDTLPLTVVTHDIRSLNRVLLLDLPDFDSYQLSHNEVVNRVIRSLDLVAWVTDPDKYADRLFHNLLEREAAFKSNFLFVFNKIDRFFTGVSADKGKKFLTQVADDFTTKLAQHDITQPQLYLTSVLWETSPPNPGWLATELNQANQLKKFIYEKLNFKLYDLIKTTNLLKLLDGFYAELTDRKLLDTLKTERETRSHYLGTGHYTLRASWARTMHPVIWSIVHNQNLTQEVLQAELRAWPGIIGMLAELGQKLVLTFTKAKETRPKLTEPGATIALTVNSRSALEVLSNAPDNLGRTHGVLNAPDTLQASIANALAAAETAIRERAARGILKRHWIVTQHVAPLGLALYVLLTPLVVNNAAFSVANTLWTLLVVPLLYGIETIIARKSVIKTIRSLWQPVIVRSNEELDRLWHDHIASVLTAKLHTYDATLELLTRLDSIRASFHRAHSPEQSARN